MKKQEYRGKVNHKFSRYFQKRLWALFAVILILFAIIVGRIVYVNISDGQENAIKVLQQKTNNDGIIPYKRGDILDTNGTILASSERVYNIILDVKGVLELSTTNNRREKSIIDTTAVLTEVFQIPKEEIDEAFRTKQDSRYVILKKQAPYEEKKRYDQYIDVKNMGKNDYEKYCKEYGTIPQYPNINGIYLEEMYLRNYPYNTLASTVLGFSNSVNLGKNGIEEKYSAYLNGVDGRKSGYYHNNLFQVEMKEETDGNQLFTTIDQNVQSIVEKYVLEFNQKYKNGPNNTGSGSEATSVIIMNPNTGAIIANAEHPNYDLNKPGDLSVYYSKEAIEAMSLEEQSEKLNIIRTNYMTSQTYEPGSTFKPFTVAMGLETGKLTGTETYHCTGSCKVNGQIIHCVQRDGHGTITLEQAMANSCNVAMMEIAAKVGVDDFTAYQSLFGFGQLTGIDLPNEVSAATLLYDKDTMKPVDLATNSFGQNFNVTMIQMASAMSALVNGGNYYKPYIVEQIKDSNGNVVERKEPTLVKKVVSEETSQVIKEELKAVVEYGSGKHAALEGYSIGGKTGTAEKIPRDKKSYLVSFIGCVPIEKPEILIYVVIDEPNVSQQANSALAQELAANIMSEVLPYLKISKIPTVPETIVE